MNWLVEMCNVYSTVGLFVCSFVRLLDITERKMDNRSKGLPE